MRHQISILSSMVLIGILRCVHGGALRPFGEEFMGRKIEAPVNITTSMFPVEKHESNGAEMVQESRSIINESTSGGSGEELTVLSCATGNPIDDCWRCDPNWERNRKRLADCSIGFGKNAIGGKNPSHGTLRYAVIQKEPLWIIFQKHMVIHLNEETIDGRGANVQIAKGPCITIKDVTNIIIHGIHIHGCKSVRKAAGNTYPLNSVSRQINHGDGISISTGKHIWVDHCSMSNCEDGLIDAAKSSNYITISNNHFTHHDKVMLLGHSDDHHHDKVMRATVALNHFGVGLVQRMPRFMASADPITKEVTKRQNSTENEWKKWNWISEDDVLLNGAYFTPSGSQVLSAYSTAYSAKPKSSALVEQLTRNAGVLSCKKGGRC